MQQFALHNLSDTLLAAAATRVGAELGHQYAGQIPHEVVETIVAHFSDWLRSACEATRPLPPRLMGNHEGGLHNAR